MIKKLDIKKVHEDPMTLNLLPYYGVQESIDQPNAKIIAQENTWLGPVEYAEERAR